MHTVRKQLEKNEKIVATVIKKENGACEEVCVRNGGKEITTFNVVNNIPNYFLKNMVRNILKSDCKIPIIIRHQEAMNTTA